MVKAVIFDWGGVLIDDPTLGIVTYCAERVDYSNLEEFGNVYMHYNKKLTKGEISEREFWERVCSKLGAVPPRENLLFDAFSLIYREKEEMWNLVRELKERGYLVGLLSNAEHPMVEFFYRRDYVFFDAVVFSCVEKTMKPERKIFETILKKLNVKAQECIFIDNMEENVLGAQKLGIKGIIFNDAVQVRKELEKLGVLGRVERAEIKNEQVVTRDNFDDTDKEKMFIESKEIGG